MGIKAETCGGPDGGKVSCGSSPKTWRQLAAIVSDVMALQLDVERLMGRMLLPVSFRYRFSVCRWISKSDQWRNEIKFSSIRKRTDGKRYRLPRSWITRSRYFSGAGAKRGMDPGGFHGSPRIWVAFEGNIVAGAAWYVLPDAFLVPRAWFSVRQVYGGPPIVTLGQAAYSISSSAYFDLSETSTALTS